jgi:S-adenosylmethionine hydrolase
MSLPNGIVALLTDFGLEDPFVGMMKGVILGRFPAARIVDVTHGVPPQDLVAGAFWLEQCCRWFAPGTVHVVVIDPGVGTARGSVAARARGQYFVAPDNGVIAGVVASDPDAEVRRLDPVALGLGTPSATFHGRDVFAPVGADLASGHTRFEALGAAGGLEVGPVLRPPSEGGGEIRGEVVVVDHFGNLITNLEASWLNRLDRAEVVVADAIVGVLPAGASYGSVPSGSLAALVSAHGTLEVAERDGNAARRLGVGSGAEIRLRAVPR